MTYLLHTCIRYVSKRRIADVDSNQTYKMVVFVYIIREISPFVTFEVVFLVTSTQSSALDQSRTLFEDRAQ